MRRPPHPILAGSREWRTDMVRNNHAGAEAAHSIGAPNRGQTSFLAHGVRAEAPQNEFRPFWWGNASLPGRFRNGVTQFARQDRRIVNRFTLTPF